MDVSAFFLILPLFIVLYGLMELTLESRKKRKGSFQRAGDMQTRNGLNGLLYAFGHSFMCRLPLEALKIKPGLEKSLSQAGNPNGWKAEEAMAFKWIGLVIMIIFLTLLDYPDLWVWPVGLLAGFFFPDLWFKSLGDTRKASLQRMLPMYVDLLSLALESGLDLLVSTERIQEKMKAGPLKDELQTMIQEYRLGTSRKDVLLHWAQRIDLSDAQSLASLIIQSDEIGGDLPTVLRNYAEDMRTRRFLRAEEMAGKIPIKILFPMIIFFFPIVFVIILGPVAMEFVGSTK